MAKCDFSFNCDPAFLPVFLVGCKIKISKPVLYREVAGLPSMARLKPGVYWVDSVVAHSDKTYEVGVSDVKTREHLDFFDFTDLQAKMQVMTAGVFMR